MGVVKLDQASRIECLDLDDDIKLIVFVLGPNTDPDLSFMAHAFNTLAENEVRFNTVLF